MSEERSVITGRLMISRASIMQAPPLLFRQLI
jgi:hypothetical protein